MSAKADGASVKTARKATRKTVARVDARTKVQRRPASEKADSLAVIRRRARRCRDCPLWKDATQTVFGEGNERARVMFVGEQPGDREDLAGRPFVGPAGHILDRALHELGVERSSIYVTNAVKHFKFLLRGKRRLHKKPGDVEIAACHQWLERELEIVQPRLIVALGATAARAVFGRTTPIEKNRQRILKHAAIDVLVTVHPSYLLRVPPEDRSAAYAGFVADLRHALPYLSED
jgi:uracil-DNA glycosylase family protein